MHQQLVSLNLPEPSLQLAKKGEQLYVFDLIRKKHLLLTPEEWVRQHWVHYLVHRAYPLSHISVESGFEKNKVKRRSDILVYKEAKPFLLIECKAPQVNITQATLDQASQYNGYYKAPYVALSNGLTHYCARYAQGGLTFIKDIPNYTDAARTNT